MMRRSLKPYRKSRVPVLKGRIGFRDVRPGDFDWLLSLRNQTMNPHLIASGIEPLEEGHVEAVNTDFEWTRVILWDRQDAGMIKVIKASDPWHLRQIQVAPSYHGRGIGTMVIRQLLDEASVRQCSVVLNVLHVNPAKLLYGRMGFEVVEFSERSQKMQWHPDDCR